MQSSGKTGEHPDSPQRSDCEIYAMRFYITDELTANCAVAIQIDASHRFWPKINKSDFVYRTGTANAYPYLPRLDYCPTHINAARFDNKRPRFSKNYRIADEMDFRHHAGLKESP